MASRLYQEGINTCNLIERELTKAKSKIESLTRDVNILERDLPFYIKAVENRFYYNLTRFFK